MTIQTKDDWWEVATKTIPLLPEYMSRFNQNIVQDKVLEDLTKCLNEKNHVQLHDYFFRIWNWLPDSPRIHQHPFGQLCDLCSEYWVFQE